MNITRRQTEILKLASAGMKYKEIAQELGISIRTVQNQMYDIFMKNDISTKFEAVMMFFGQNAGEF